MKLFKGTKFKIILGYLILIIGTCFAGYLLSARMYSLIKSDDVAEYNSVRHTLLNRILTAVYDSEYYSNAYMQTDSSIWVDRYVGAVLNISNDLDSLNLITDDVDQKDRLDSLSSLLVEKLVNMEALVKIKKSYVKKVSYDKLYQRITTESPIGKVNPGIVTSVKTRRDSSYVTRERRRALFGKKVDSSLLVTVSHKMVIDTIIMPDIITRTDTVFNIFSKAKNDLPPVSHFYSWSDALKQYDVITQSSLISHHLRRLLNEYDKEYLNDYVQLLGNRASSLDNAMSGSIRILAFSLIIILILLYLILGDISKSQIYRKRLEHSNKLANDLLAGRETMVHTIVHDIKSPVGSILGYVELMENSNKEEDRIKYLSNINKSANHILSLTKELLLFYKLEENVMSVDEVDFTPGGLLEDVIALFEPMAKDKAIALNMNVSDVLYENFKGDALKIGQIITNIVSNSVKYTDKGKVSIDATYQDGKFKIVISDTGRGMSQEEQKKIGGEFTRLSNVGNVEGSGLGLAITLRLIKLLGGKISINSVLNEGSTFSVSIPIIMADAVVVEKQSNESHEEDNYDARCVKVVFVDDDILQLEMAKAMLQCQNVSVKTLQNGTKIVDTIKSFGADMVFTDIQMPEISGFDVVSAIRRSNAEFASIPVIALSADSTLSPEKYDSAGFTGSIAKPYSGGALIECVEKNLHVHVLKRNPQLSNLYDFAAGDEDAVQQVVDSFISETKKNLSLMDSHLKDGKYDLLVKLCHKMLPMFKIFNASDCIDSLVYIERMDTSKPDVEKVSELVASIKVNAMRLIENLGKRKTI